MNLLVTGAGGNVGARLAPRLRGKFPSAQLRFVIHHSAPSALSFPDEIVVTDLTHRDDFDRATQGRWDGVIHLASLTDVDACERDPQTARAVNAEVTRRLCERFRDKRIVFVSTDYVFDGTHGSYAPSDVTHPQSVYGSTKRAAEEMVLSVSRGLVIRTAGIYDWALGKTFLSFVERCARAGQSVRAATDIHYSPTWADDLARALIGLVDSSACGILHFAGSEAMTRYQFARVVVSELDADEKLIMPATQDSLGLVARRPADSTLNSESGYALSGVCPTPLAEVLRLPRGESRTL